MSRYFGSSKERVDGDHDKLGRKRKTHCKQGHPYDEANTYWHRNWKGYLCRGCRICVREAMQRRRRDPEVKKAEAEKSARWRKEHPEKYRAGWQQEQTAKRQYLLEARVNGCIRCGEKDPACLDFHHRDGGTTKDGDIATLRRFGWARLRAEIAKCDVLCANCHRKHHRDERQKQERER